MSQTPETHKNDKANRIYFIAQNNQMKCFKSAEPVTKKHRLEHSIGVGTLIPFTEANFGSALSKMQRNLFFDYPILGTSDWSTIKLNDIIKESWRWPGVGSVWRHKFKHFKQSAQYNVSDSVTEMDIGLKTLQGHSRMFIL